MAFTFFFRDLQTLELIRDHALPHMRTAPPIRIWDAGCAMGPEPYSLAIVLRQSMGPMLYRNVKIHASDIDESGHFGEIIQAGIYPVDQIKRMPKDVQKTYFAAIDQPPHHFRINEEIRKSVIYHHHDLLTFTAFEKNFSLILCKNVLLHFNAEQRIQVLDMFHRALRAGGFLVTEQTQKMPSERLRAWEQVVSNARIYRKIDGNA